MLIHNKLPDECITLGPLPGPTLADHRVAALLIPAKDVSKLVQRGGVGYRRFDVWDANFLAYRPRPRIRRAATPAIGDAVLGA
jgi:hypothetical protein